MHVKHKAFKTCISSPWELITNGIVDAANDSNKTSISVGQTVQMKRVQEANFSTKHH